MNNAAPNLSDTSTWLPLDGLAPGFDANKAPHSTALSGLTIGVTEESGSRTDYTFAGDSVIWEFAAAAGSPLSSARGNDSYEAFEVDEGLVFVQIHRSSEAELAISLVLDLAHGRALTVTQEIGDRLPGSTAVRQQFVAGILDGSAVSGAAPAPSTTLLGRRVMWVYSTVHAYEHVYLSPQWYSWQCLAGPERGLADTDENSIFQIRPGIYVFAWREKVIPCASVTIADHRDITRSVRTGSCSAGTSPARCRPTSPSARTVACSARPCIRRSTRPLASPRQRWWGTAGASVLVLEVRVQGGEAMLTRGQFDLQRGRS